MPINNKFTHPHELIYIRDPSRITQYLFPIKVIEGDYRRCTYPINFKGEILLGHTIPLEVSYCDITFYIDAED